MLQRRVGHPLSYRLSPRFALLLALCAGVVSSACRTPQEGGPRRKESDAGIDSAVMRSPTTCAALACEDNAECEEANGKAACVCKAGYNGDPKHCEDVNECENSVLNACSPNATCRNTPGSYTCKCNEGFTGNGKDCVELDSCGENTNICHSDAMCTNASEGVQCSCREGFTGDGQVCADIDECAGGKAECKEHSSCQNQRAGYVCNCDALFEGDGKSGCRDACDVALADANRCDRNGHARCSFAADGSASCTSCLPGYLGNGKTCTASSDCAALNCGDNTVCDGSAGSRSCKCAPGFSGNPPNSPCSDVDECVTGQAMCDGATSRCQNTPGGYACLCKPGFERVNGACVNIDECARDLDLCDSSAICSDRTPDASSDRGYTCQCKPGYQGDADGFICVDIDECGESDPEQPACAKSSGASCRNKKGGYDCVCPNGYVGDARKEPCYCDLSGYWAVRQDSTLSLPKKSAGNVDIIDASMTRATVWELHRIMYDGTRLVIDAKGCGADVPLEIHSPLYEESYATYIPNAVYDQLALQQVIDMPLSKQDAVPDPMKSFMTPRSAVVLGLKMNDPLNDPWPMKTGTITAEQWTDPDNDGEPGITLWPSQTSTKTMDGKDTYSYLPVALEESSSRIATRVGCVSTALRSITSRQMKIESCGRMTGKLFTEKTEGRVHSCGVLRMAEWDTVDITCTSKDWSSLRHCTEEQVQFLDEQDQTSKVEATFEFEKLGGLDAKDIDCAAVRKKWPAIPRQ